MSVLSAWRLSVFGLAALAAGMSPLMHRPMEVGVAADTFPGWPSAIEGRAARALPLAEREAAFAREFPGRVGRFSDGEREIILRWVATPTRRLHPASDCFRGLGYKVSPLPMRTGGNGAPMSCFRAQRATDAFEVCEQVTSASGQSWPDISSWYWHALWSGRATSWWSLVVATPVPRNGG